MSDDNVNLQESEEQVVDDALIGTDDAPEGEETEALTQGAEDDQEQDLIDLDSMTTGTQTPTEVESKRELNRSHAELRIKQKEAKRKLEENKFSPDNAELKKPKRIDFVNDTRLYDEFGGNADVARAAYEDAVDDYNEQVNSSVATQRNDTQAEHDRLEQINTTEEKFETEAVKVSKRVKGFDVKIQKAEEYLTYNGSLAIKQMYPDSAPLMLALLGSNRELATNIASIQDPQLLYRELAKLESQAQKAMTPKKTLSTAPEETAVAGDIGAIDSLEKALDAAADDPKKFDEYMRIKKQLAALKAKR